MKKSWILWTGGLVIAAAVGVGCEKKETVFEIDSPEGGIKVERDKETGAVEVEVDEK